jgi:prepilin-type N-terminal cleavage/methylation domain-containing protein
MSTTIDRTKRSACRSVRARSQAGFTIIEILVVVVVIGILMSIALPAINGVRESARNSDCMNRMRQLGIGLQVYESRTGMFPPATTTIDAKKLVDYDEDNGGEKELGWDGNWYEEDNCPCHENPSQKDHDGDGKGDRCDDVCNLGVDCPCCGPDGDPAGSACVALGGYEAIAAPIADCGLPKLGRHHVLTFILPYLELDYISANLDYRWNSNQEANTAITKQDVHLFLCPSAPERIGDAATDYTVAYGIDNDLYEEFVLAGYSGTEEALCGPVDISGRETLLQKDLPTSTASIRDGLGSTIMMVERAGLPYSYEQGSHVGKWNMGRDNWFGYTTPFPITDLDCGIYQFINCKNRQEIYSFHPEGAVFLYGDGAAKFESEAMSPAVFANRLTRKGGEIEFRE